LPKKLHAKGPKNCKQKLIPFVISWYAVKGRNKVVQRQASFICAKNEKPIKFIALGAHNHVIIRSYQVELPSLFGKSTVTKVNPERDSQPAFFALLITGRS
jgi:hypothetical protein